MNRSATRTTLSRLVLAVLPLLSLLALRLAATPAAAQAPLTPAPAAGSYVVMLPMLSGGATSNGGANPNPSPNPTPNGQLPAELRGTWMAGNLSSMQLYNPATGQWLPEVLGLGQGYELRADGTYTYAAQLTVGSFPCVSRSSVYETGKVQARGAQLELTPTFYRNRTAVCGSAPSETSTLPEPQKRTYLIQFDEGGFAQLYLDNGTTTSNFVRKDGPRGQAQPMPVPNAIVGTWRSGAIDPESFFDPQNRVWDENPAPGLWYRFNADGTYTYGAFASRVVNGCTQRVWLYATGKIEGSARALKLTPEYFPGPSFQRAHDSCQGGEPAQVGWQGGVEVLAWSLDGGRLTLNRGPYTDIYIAD